jgi:hypothetical protein
VKIEILYFPGCPNYLRAIEHLQKALLEEHVSAEVKHVQVLDAATAMTMRFLGSPSIHINGLDVERPARSGEVLGLCCRTYPGMAARAHRPLNSSERQFASSSALRKNNRRVKE